MGVESVSTEPFRIAQAGVRLRKNSERDFDSGATGVDPCDDELLRFNGCHPRDIY